MDISYIIQSAVYILKGCTLTLEIYAITAVFSVPLAIALALGKVSKSRTLRRILGIYAWIFRGTPLLLQLFFFYYGLSIFGINLPPLVAAGLTFVINYAAYLMEIFRAGIESIEKGQYEAAKALNMTYWQTMRRIILPQTVKRVLPPTCNEAINLVKDTALVAVIGMGDLLQVAKGIFTRDFTVVPFIIAAAVYLLMTSVIVQVFRKLEQKHSYYL